MCFFNSRAPAEPPAPAPAPDSAANAANRAPVLQNQYDPSSPESGVAAEKGSAMNKSQRHITATCRFRPNTCKRWEANWLTNKQMRL